jgi:hypothetical protein
MELTNKSVNTMRKTKHIDKKEKSYSRMIDANTLKVRMFIKESFAPKEETLKLFNFVAFFVI